MITVWYQLGHKLQKLQLSPTNDPSNEATKPALLLGNFITFFEPYTMLCRKFKLIFDQNLKVTLKLDHSIDLAPLHACMVFDQIC